MLYLSFRGDFAVTLTVFLYSVMIIQFLAKVIGDVLIRGDFAVTLMVFLYSVMIIQFLAKVIGDQLGSFKAGIPSYVLLWSPKSLIPYPVIRSRRAGPEGYRDGNLPFT